MNNLVLNNGRRANFWDAFDIDNFFGDVLRPVRLSERRGELVPAIDVTESESDYRIKAELPGVNKDDLDVSVHDGVLTISAESRYEDSEEKDGRVIRQERRYGKFSRSMRLGDDVDSSNVKAEYKNGVLELKLAKLEEVKPKKIAIAVN